MPTSSGTPYAHKPGYVSLVFLLEEARSGAPFTNKNHQQGSWQGTVGSIVGVVEPFVLTTKRECGQL